MQIRKSKTQHNSEVMLPEAPSMARKLEDLKLVLSRILQRRKRSKSRGVGVLQESKTKRNTGNT